MLTGTAPSTNAASTVSRYSGLLCNPTATTSPCPTPRAASVPATRLARTCSSAWLIRRSPWTTAARVPATSPAARSAAATLIRVDGGIPGVGIPGDEVPGAVPVDGGRGNVSSDSGVSAQQVAGDDESLHLVGALEDPHGSHRAVPPLERQVLRVPHAAVDLERAVHDPADHPGAVQLGHRGRVPRVGAPVGVPRGPQGEPAPGLQLGLRVRDHPLD